MLDERIYLWQLNASDGEEFQQISERLYALADALYSTYEPTIGPFSEYWQRLEAWIENVDTEEDQKLLFRLAAEVFFVGARELDSLYRVAFNANITQWLIDQLNCTLDDPELHSKVSKALERTWFCPITDSMRINAFYHLNHISGRDYRPDWRSLARFGDPVSLCDYLRQNIDRVVLLEDFVGSGSQIEAAVKFLRELPHRPQTLLVPLIICPAGLTAAKTWQFENPALKVAPVMRLGARDFLTDKPVANEPGTLARFRKLVEDTFPQVLNGADPIATKTYTPYGFWKTGSLVVLATNCPDNTLPLLHHRSATWNPLFPRASRI